MKKRTQIYIDTEMFKAVLKSEYDNGYIDNLRYIELLSWVKEYEKEKPKHN